MIIKQPVWAVNKMNETSKEKIKKKKFSFPGLEQGISRGETPEEENIFKIYLIFILYIIFFLKL